MPGLLSGGPVAGELRSRHLAPDGSTAPQVSKEQFDKIMSLIQTGIDEGAKLQTGGKRHGERGYYVQPTVFSDVKGA